MPQNVADAKKLHNCFINGQGFLFSTFRNFYSKDLRMLTRHWQRLSIICSTSLTRRMQKDEKRNMNNKLWQPRMMLMMVTDGNFSATG